MDVNSAYSSGLLGIKRGMQGLDRNAAEVAGATAASDGTRSVVDPLVEAQTNRLQVEAGAEVVRTVDDTVGTLLDEMA